MLLSVFRGAVLNSGQQSAFASRTSFIVFSFVDAQSGLDGKKEASSLFFHSLRTGFCWRFDQRLALSWQDGTATAAQTFEEWSGSRESD